MQYLNVIGALFLVVIGVRLGIVLLGELTFAAMQLGDVVRRYNYQYCAVASALKLHEGLSVVSIVVNNSTTATFARREEKREREGQRKTKTAVGMTLVTTNNVAFTVSAQSTQRALLFGAESCKRCFFFSLHMH